VLVENEEGCEDLETLGAWWDGHGLVDVFWELCLFVRVCSRRCVLFRCFAYLQ